MPKNPLLYSARPREESIRLDAPSYDPRPTQPFSSDIRPHLRERGEMDIDAAERDASVARLARSLAGMSEADRARYLDRFEQGVRENLSANAPEQPAPRAAQTRLDAFEPEGRAEMILRQAEAWKAPPTPGQHTQRQDAADENDPEALRRARIQKDAERWRRK